MPQNRVAFDTIFLSLSFSLSFSLFLILSLLTDCEVCRKTQTTGTRCRVKPKKRVDGIALSTKIGDLITTDYEILNVETSEDADTKNALIVQDDVTKWIQSFSMKTKETSETMSCSQRFILPSQKPDAIYTEKFPRVYNSLSRFAME